MENFVTQNTKTELEKHEILRLSARESNKLTRECLQTALLILLAEKPLEQITITKLVQRAGVSRSAFYRNYNTKEDVLDDCIKTNINKLKISMKEFAFVDKHGWFVKYFQILKENIAFMPNLLYPNLINKFFSQEKNIFNVLLEDIPQKYHYKSLAFIGAVAELTLFWITNGMKETIEEMATVCADIFNSLIEK